MNQPTDLPKISAVVLRSENDAHTVRTLQSLAAANYPDLQVVLIDRQPEILTSAYWEYQCAGVEVVAAPRLIGIGEAINIGLEAVRNEWLLLVTEPIFFKVGALQAIAEKVSSHADADAFSPRIVDETTGEIVYAGAFLSNQADLPSIVIGSGELAADNHTDVRYTELASTDCVLIRTSTCRSLGGIPAHYYFYIDGTSICRELHQTGRAVLYVGSSTVLRAAQPVKPVVKEKPQIIKTTSVVKEVSGSLSGFALDLEYLRSRCLNYLVQEAPKQLQVFARTALYTLKRSLRGETKNLPSVKDMRRLPFRNEE